MKLIFLPIGIIVGAAIVIVVIAMLLNNALDEIDHSLGMPSRHRKRRRKPR